MKETSNRLAELGKGTVTGVVADLASLQQVEGLATQVKEILGDTKLTALVNNAGVYSAKRATTQDGLELTFGVNVAAPFLLTSLLLPSVAERVVNVASISAASSIDFDNLQQVSGRGNSLLQLQQAQNCMCCCASYATLW